MVGQHDRILTLAHRLLGQAHAFGHRVDLGPVHQIVAQTPGGVRHVVGDVRRKLGIAIGDHLEGHTGLGRVHEGEAVVEVHIDIGLARFPGQGSLHQVHPRRTPGPLQYRRREDRRLACFGHRFVVAADRTDQRACRAFALQIAVVVRVVLHAEGQVGIPQEILILVAVRIEGAGDEGLGPDHLADTARELRFGLGDIAYPHRAMQGQIGAVERPLRLELGDHLVDEVIVGAFVDPTGAGAGLRKQRRFDADQFHVGVFARHLHEAAHVAAWRCAQQRLATGRRTFVDEVLETRVVRQEGHRLVHEVDDRDAHRFARTARLGGSLRTHSESGGGQHEEGQYRSSNDVHRVALEDY